MRINRIVSDLGRSECRFIFGNNTYSFPAAVGSGKEFRMPDLEGGIDSLFILWSINEYFLKKKIKKKAANKLPFLITGHSK